MELRTPDVKTVRDVRNELIDKVLITLNVPDTKEERESSPVQQQVSNLLLPELVGRPFPTKSTKVRANRDALRLTREWQEPIYPRKLKTDQQKYKYLQDMFLDRNITQEIFNDLSSVLKVKKPSKRKIIF